MRREFFTTILLAGFAGIPAIAGSAGKMDAPIADAQISAPAASVALTPPQVDWTGAFVGSDLDYGNYGLRGASSRNMGTLGVFGGYRADLGGAVLGVEGRVAPVSYGSTTLPGGDSLKESADLLLTAGVPFGATGASLAHLSAGPSFLRTSGGGAGSGWTTGATVRVGVDHMLDQNLMLRGAISHTRASNLGLANDQLRETSATVGLGFRF